jgi:hypothetical protein
MESKRHVVGMTAELAKLLYFTDAMIAGKVIIPINIVQVFIHSREWFYNIK